MIDHASLYVSKFNFAVFPVHWIRDDSSCSCRRADCRNPGKHPLTRDGFHSATKNLKQIDAWWRRYPEANVAIATGRASGVVVLDVDPRHGGFESLTRYQLPKTMKARTGGGGEHYYFRCPAETLVRNSAGKLGAGLDVRGEGGYIVAPPSNHLQGIYEWELWDAIADAPEDLFRAFSAFRGSAVEGELTTKHPKSTNPVSVFPAGTRNNELASLAGTMRHRGFSREAIEVALLAENRQRCRPPLEVAEVKDIARSIARYEVGPEVDRVRRVNRVDFDGKVELFDETSVHPVNSENSVNSENLANSDNSLKIWRFNEFLSQSFATKENICFEAGSGDVVMVAARTNGGKSTFLRNCLLSLATGRELGEFVPKQRPRKVVLLDFEADEAELQQDLALMTQHFSVPEKDLLAQNFRLVAKGLIGGELFQLNRHFNFVSDITKGGTSEVIVIDNISAAFSLNDENNNSEMTEKVSKPLARLAQMSGAVIVFAHHIGKLSETAREDVYLGRGASALSCLAKSVFNLRGRVDQDEAMEVCCVKRKSGPNYKRSFRLNRANRWFEAQAAGEMAATTARKRNNYELILEWLQQNAPAARPVKTSALLEAFPKMGRTSLMINLREGVIAGDILMPQRAFYSAAPPSEK
jgi:Bifunctional DNA primase/polymerase, N-terminal/AAA domain/Primase C terminal 1 (PriCT-1)